MKIGLGLKNFSIYSRNKKSKVKILSDKFKYLLKKSGLKKTNRVDITYSIVF